MEFLRELIVRPPNPLMRRTGHDLMALRVQTSGGGKKEGLHRDRHPVRGRLQEAHHRCGHAHLERNKS
ncbi:MAG: hypothetical protein O7E56_11550 [SAR324 cluster bacterium]|nr:hypothetical protein [SAR324 cluster bacterium]